MFESELAEAEQDMALRLEELEGLQQQRDDLQQALAAARSAQAEAESSGDERRQKAALEDVQVRLDDLAALAQKIRTVQMLYDQAVAGYMLASERQRLYRVPEEGGSAGPRGPILGGSTQMLQLTDKEIALFEKNKSILKARAQVLSEEIVSADDRLQKGNLSARARRSLEHRRRQRLDERQAIESQMSETRKNLARVKAQTGSKPKRSY